MITDTTGGTVRLNDNPATGLAGHRRTLLMAVASIVSGMALVAGLALEPSSAQALSAAVVKVSGTQGSWGLTVGGKPYTVKGVTYDPHVNDPTTYLPDIASMGANTVRDWGTDVSPSTTSFFAAARTNRLRVIAGLWIDTRQDWSSNAAYQKATLASIRSTVTAYKNNDAVLLWDVGNEVMLNLPSTAQRVAYAKFIEKAVTAIHAIDRNHPVTSTDATTSYWPVYQKYAPSLDVFGLNTYGGISSVESAWRTGSFTHPYVVTEAGTPGTWEAPSDANGQPIQPSDAVTAGNYATAWKHIAGARGISLGGTMFHYSKQKDQQSLWFDLRPGDLRRASYYALAAAWGGHVGSNRPPVISSLRFSAGSVKAGRAFTVAAPAADPDRDKVSWGISMTASTIDQNGTPSSVGGTWLSAGRYSVKAPATPGVYRLYVRVTDGRGNVGIESKTIKVTR